jgi:Domain of Unknown Function (DUF1206)
VNRHDAAVTSADDAVRHPVVRALGRIGLVAYGLVHLMLAGLLVQVAFGDRERVDKKGALVTLAETGPGVALLWIITVGLVAMVVWQLGEAFFDHRGLPVGRRVLRSTVNLAEAALFGVLAYSAWSIAAADGRAAPKKSFATTVFELPGGPWLVALAGLVVVVGAAYAVRRGLTGRFLRDLDLRGAGLNRSLLVTRVGRLGWSALGVAYGVPGVLLVVAGATYDAAAPTGLDAGLQRVAGEPYGPALLVLLAVGLVAFAAYCLFDARYRKA